MGAALVLNATYEPLCVVPLRRAVVLVLAEKALVVEASDHVMHSERLSLPIPTVVRLARFVRVPYRRDAPLTRRAVLDRDGHSCVYCGLRADTIDHVRPRSRGGQHSWTNVVAACARCNHRKGDRTLSELGWQLPHPPVQPPATVAVVMGWTAREPSWERYLGLSGGGLSGGLGSGLVSIAAHDDDVIAPAV
jgi:5-methylcytosine-specific restriction endonuclease McrA